MTPTIINLVRSMRTSDLCVQTSTQLHSLPPLNLQLMHMMAADRSSPSRSTRIRTQDSLKTKQSEVRAVHNSIVVGVWRRDFYVDMKCFWW